MSELKNTDADTSNAEELEIREAHHAGKLQGSPLSQSMISSAKETIRTNVSNDKITKRKGRLW